MNYYLTEHRQNRYLPEEHSHAGLLCCTNKTGWQDWYIGKHILFSHRVTDYNISVFPEKLHSHDFYEMDIYITGKISYVSGSKEIFPERDNILIFPPECTHTARMQENGRYERYVFYFSPIIFNALDCHATPPVFCDGRASCRFIESEKRAEFFYVFEKLRRVLNLKVPDAGLLAYSYVIQLIYIIANGSSINKNSITTIPQNVYDVKRYVDQNFQTVGTVTDVANHFFYSREYVSRIFKQYYNMNISEYLAIQKINFAKQQLEEGKSVSYVSDLAGFRSMSAFVNTFKAQTGSTPSEYKQATRKRSNSKKK